MLKQSTRHKAQGTLKAAVLGQPISHSLSPALHSHWLKKYHISGSYEAIDTPESELQNTLQNLLKRNFSGVNLTVPLKEKAILFLDSIDESAERIGAVNTIIFENKKMHGTNTDDYGFIQNIQSPNHLITQSSAFIFGAGGAARAVISGLIDAGTSSIMICNRNQKRAEELAQMMINNTAQGAARSVGPIGISVVQSPQRTKCKKVEIKTCDWNSYQHHLSHHSLIINTTSLGMKNQPPLEVDFSKCAPETLVTDIVYNPLITPFLQNAKEKNLKTIDGLGMLLYQGQKAFEYFFGVLPEVTEELRVQMIKDLKPKT